MSAHDVAASALAAAFRQLHFDAHATSSGEGAAECRVDAYPAAVVTFRANPRNALVVEYVIGDRVPVRVEYTNSVDGARQLARLVAGRITGSGHLQFGD